MSADGFYRAFEDRFRGSPEEIRGRLAAYRPLLRALSGGGGPHRALDLGCGRGEWLEIAADEGLEARGVDLDDGMLARARAAGLDARRGDALGALREAPARSLAVVSGIHLAEHLPFAVLSELVGLALTALRPGGVLILETPDAENLRVGTLSFHNDPTHVRPVPAMVLAFLAEHHGFAEAATWRLNAPPRRDPPGLWDVIAHASPDYALVARAPGGPPLALDAPPGGVALAEIVEAYDEARRSEIRALGKRLEARMDGMDRIAALREAERSSGILGRLIARMRGWR